MGVGGGGANDSNKQFKSNTAGLRVHIADTEEYFTTSRIIIIMHRDWQSNRTICNEYWSLLSGCS